MFGLGLGRVAVGPCPPHLVPTVSLGAGDILGQIHAFETGKTAGGGDQRFDVKVAVRVMGEGGVRRALLADRAGQAAGVDTTDGDAATCG